MRISSLFSFSLAVFITPFSAVAQDATLPPVVVTADRIDTPLEQVGSSVTVITGEDMRARGITQVFDAIRMAPGVTVSRSGGVGGVSGIRIRGSNPGQVRVMIDGVLVNDPANVDASFDFNHLTVDAIDRIEIVRGPQSVLYGSDAIGGVVNIITHKGGGKPQHNAFVEAGTYHTLRAGVGTRGGFGDWRYALSARHDQTHGFSHSSAGEEKDGAETHSINGSLGYDVSDNLSLSATGGYSRIYAGFDPSATTDGAAFLEKQVLRGRLAANLLTLDGDWEHEFALEGADTHRSFDEPTGFYRFSTFDGSTVAAEYQSTLHLRERDAWIAGLRQEWQRAYTTTTSGGAGSVDMAGDLDNQAIFTQYQLGIGEDTTLTGGVRLDSHDIFGNHATYRLTASHQVTESTRLHASVGTGFKAPTLYQLYSSFGNEDLNPEESTGYDIGIEQDFWGDKATFSLTGFLNQYDDLIDFDTGAGGYVNLGESESYGIETGLTVEPTDQWALHASHTYLMAENTANDRMLPRRPKHVLQVGAEHRFANNALLGGEVRYVSKQLDSNFADSFTKAYTTIDLHGSYPFNDRWEGYARLENLLNRDYQETFGFNAAGRSLYGGLRLRF